MLEVARVIANLDLPYTLEFVAFGAEESVDGIYYVETYLKNRPHEVPIVGMISIDMIGVGSRFYVCTLGLASPYLRDKALTSAKMLGIPVGIITGKPWSDHEPFEKAGIPSVWFHRRRDSAYHTRRDQPKNIQLSHLRTAAAAVVIHLLISLDEQDLQQLARQTRK